VEKLIEKKPNEVASQISKENQNLLELFQKQQ